EVATEVTNGENLVVAAPQAGHSTKIYKVPINAREYFLIENRNRDFNNDNVAFARDGNGVRVEFVWDDNGQQLRAEGPIGVITQVSEYDFGLPGSGILIWHIDDNVIAANLASNRVNADPEHRGVDLEEADGAQDLGQVFGLLSPGAGAENGVIEDMFWGSNQINMLVNNSDVVAFTPFTMPSSAANSGADSHIYVTDFSEPDTLMRFSVRNDVSNVGFPQFTGSMGAFSTSPLATDLDGDGVQEIISTSREGTDVLVWRADGTKLIENQDSVAVVQVNGKAASVPLARFATPRGTRVFSPAAVGFQNAAVLVVTTDRVVAAYRSTDTDLDGRADSLFVFDSSEEFSTAPLVVSKSSDEFEVYAGTARGGLVVVSSSGSGTILANLGTSVVGLALVPGQRIAFTTLTGDIGFLEQNGNVVWRQPTGSMIAKSPVVADLDQNGVVDVVAVTEDGTLFAFDEKGELLPGYPRRSGVRPTSEMALADVDGDGFMNIVFVSGQKLYSYGHTGALSEHFPVLLSLNQESELSTTSSPALVDMNDDGAAEILVGSPEGGVFAVDAAGQISAGFPLSTGAAVGAAPFITDLEGDGDLDLIAAADDGFVYVWDLDVAFKPENVSWAGLFADAGHASHNLKVLTPAQAGEALMPSKSVYNYPNPTEGGATTIRYTLNAPAEVRIKIYDLAGDFVDELSGTGFAPAVNEVEWSVNGVESGVYLARVEARNESNKDVAIIKIAVVK
ncbi:MAG: T9SS C-terminal target domain-containing protein, partial [Calditrichaeota bacterium]